MSARRLLLRHDRSGESQTLATWTPRGGFEVPEDLVHELEQFFLRTEFAEQGPREEPAANPCVGYRLCSDPPKGGG